MGLLSILKKLKQKEKSVRVLFLGLDNAGKTSITTKMRGGDISTLSPTLGFEISTLEHRGYNLQVWDVGGQATIRAYWKNYYESTDALVYVIDSADRRRLRTVRDEIRSVLGQEKLSGCSVLVFANKQDILGAMGPEELADALGLDDSVFNKRHWCLQPCSAVTGEGLVAGMDWLVKDVASRIFLGSE